VGWLARDHEFPKGEVSERFVARLQELCAHARTQQTRGLHACELCPKVNQRENYIRLRGDNHRSSSAEIRAIGADGTRYAAPTLVLHYVIEHAYAPPVAFVDAVLRMESLTWENARANKLCMSCGGKLVADSRMAVFVAGDPENTPFFWCETCAARYRR
jgi:hypothetical protein